MRSRVQEEIIMGIGRRFAYAFRCFFSIVGSGEIPEDVVRELISLPAALAPEAMTPPAFAPESKPGPEPISPSDGAVQILALLQRHARLIDFFTEDLSPYSDAEVGVAIRSLQQSCQEAITRYIKLAPIVPSSRGQQITLEEGFDRATIRLIGGAKRKPPLKGLLQHSGWRVEEINLPPLPAAALRSILAPAEVEVEGALEAAGDEKTN